MVLFVDDIDEKKDDDCFDDVDTDIFIEDTDEPEGDGLVECIRFIINKRVVVIPTLFINYINRDYLKELDGENCDVAINKNYISVDVVHYNSDDVSEEHYKSENAHFYSNVVCHLVRLKLFSKYRGGIVC